MYPKIVRVRSGGKKQKEITYLRLIEKYRGEDGKKHDRVVANIARLDVEGRKAFNRLLKSLAKFSDEVLVSPEEIEARVVLEYGAVEVIRKLWEEIGLEKWIEKGCAKKVDGNLGSAGVLSMICNRLMEPKSELGLCEWLEGVYSDKFDKRFHNGKLKSRAERFYRTLDWLIEGKEKIEQEIYQWVKTLFPVDVVFYDITNVQFEGEGPKIARRGYVRLGKKNHNQVLLGIILVEGLPVAHYVFRGNRVEKTTVKWISKDVKKKYNVDRIIFVMDRGMISAINLEELEKQDDGYIVAMKRRRDDEVKMLLEDGEDGFIEIKKDLYGKEVNIDSDGQRRLICVNTARAKEDKEKREAIMKELEEELSQLKEKVDGGKIKQQKNIIAMCEKILSKRYGKRYFSYELEGKNFCFSKRKDNIEYEEKIDGKFMIKTTEKALTLQQIVFRYKDLMDIEDAFRDIKNFIKVAPIYHRLNKRVRAHIFVCVLSLLVQRYMEKKLADNKLKISSEKVLSKLKTIKVVINQVKNLCLKYVVTPTAELSHILRIFGIDRLPKMLSDISRQTIPEQKTGDIMFKNGFG
jgi:transposase